jgi:hypothetical protein
MCQNLSATDKTKNESCLLGPTNKHVRIQNTGIETFYETSAKCTGRDKCLYASIFHPLKGVFNKRYLFTQPITTLGNVWKTTCDLQGGDVR